MQITKQNLYHPRQLSEQRRLVHFGLCDRSKHFIKDTNHLLGLLLSADSDRPFVEMMVRAEPPSGVWPGSGVIDLPFVCRPLTQNREQCGATQWDCCPQGTFSTGGDEVLIITASRFISQAEAILSNIFYIYLKASLNSYYILTLICSTTLPV